MLGEAEHSFHDALQSLFGFPVELSGEGYFWMSAGAAATNIAYRRLLNFQVMKATDPPTTFLTPYSI